MISVPLSLLAPLVVVTLVVVLLTTPTQGQSSCSSGASSYQASVSYSQAYSQRYTTRCGWWSRCTRYRTRYRTAYTTETTCCPGFQGPYCTDIIECLSSPCLNGGTCSNHVNRYSCLCTSGWYGSRCQYEVDECNSMPCQNGGMCNDLLDAFNCTCTAGWTGTTCEAEIDECDPNPCENGGTCYDMFNGFDCACAEGWTGTTCQTEINECQSNPCQNGGSCLDLFNGYRCMCDGGYTGTTCVIDIDECESDPCDNSGMCNNHVDAFSCTCVNGWTGATCDTAVDECAKGHNCSQRCVNQGMGLGLICACYEGYQLQQDGTTCEDIDECFVMDDCDQGCSNTEGSYICSCNAGYNLDIDMRTCNDIDECISSPCFNGECNNMLNSYSCTCSPGWSGFHCNDDIDECSSVDLNACSQLCANTDGSYDCRCDEGYELFTDGTTCNDIDECVVGHKCMHICNNTLGAYTCSCHPGYSLHANGFACVDIDECASSPCFEEGTWDCYNMENAYSCQCHMGWRGINCKNDVDECQEGTPCNQTCTNSPGSFACSCLPGYYLDDDGFSCQDVDECSPNPCQNGAECTNLLNAFSCECGPGWEGLTCDIDIDECDSGPCANDGTCVNLLDAFSCNCTEGWYGSHCQSGYCASNPCLNGGTCIPAERRCTCSSMYAGTICDIYQTPDGVPTVTHHPGNKTAEVSERIVLNCQFLNVQHFDWWKDGKKIPFTRDMSDYVINAITPPDQGYYRCIGIRENQPDVESERALLRIRDMSIFHLTFKLLGEFMTFHADPESPAYQTLVRGITEKFEGDFGLLQTETAALEQGAIYFHVNQLLPDNGVVVDMRAYIANSDMTPQEELDFMWSGLSSLANSSDGLFDPSLLRVESTVLCPPLSWSSQYGIVQFASGELHSWDDSSGQCPWFTVNTGEPIARAVCSGDYIFPCAWEPSDNCGGNKTADQLLIYLQQQAIDGDNIQLILSELDVITKNSINITSAGVTAAYGVIQQIGTTAQPTQENAADVVNILSNLAVLDENVIEEAEMTNGAISDATLALEDILLNLNVSQDMGFQHVAPNVLVQAISLQSTSIRDGLVLSVTGDGSANQAFDSSNVQISSPNRGSTENEDHLKAAITIPNEAIDSDNMENVAFTVYRDDSFFITDDDHQADVVEDSARVSDLAINTNVIGASIGSTNGSQQLDDLVTIFLAHKQRNATDPQCVYWDYSMNAWSRDGCHITNSTETHTECQCNHLTNFAVLMDVSGNRRRSEKVERVFRILSFIGCTFSIIGLVMTLVVYLTDEKLRHSQPLQILMCLCATLLSLYIFFIIMTALDQRRDETEVDSGSCGFIAAVLHFSVLSSMSWMGIEGMNMFLMIVRVMNTYIPFFMLKASMIAWGLPAVVVILTGAIARDNYANSDYCFLQKWPLIGGLLIPMAIILLHNVFVFAIVMRRLMLIGSGIRKATDLKLEDLHEIMQRLKNAVSILLLLGLTWIVGYLTVIEQLNLAVHVIFILLNSLQGFFIFVFYVLRQPRSRSRLAELVRGLLCCSRGTHTISKSDPLSLKQTSMKGTDNPSPSTIYESALSRSKVDASYVSEKC